MKEIDLLSILQKSLRILSKNLILALIYIRYFIATHIIVFIISGVIGGIGGYIFFLSEDEKYGTLVVKSNYLKGNLFFNEIEKINFLLGNKNNIEKVKIFGLNEGRILPKGMWLSAELYSPLDKKYFDFDKENILTEEFRIHFDSLKYAALVKDRSLFSLDIYIKDYNDHQELNIENIKKSFIFYFKHNKYITEIHSAKIEALKREKKIIAEQLSYQDSLIQIANSLLRRNPNEMTATVDFFGRSIDKRSSVQEISELYMKSSELLERLVTIEQSINNIKEIEIISDLFFPSGRRDSDLYYSLILGAFYGIITVTSIIISVKMNSLLKRMKK